MEVVAYKMAKQSKALQDEMRSNMDDSIAEIKSYHSVKCGNKHSYVSCKRK